MVLEIIISKLFCILKMMFKNTFPEPQPDSASYPVSDTDLWLLYPVSDADIIRLFPLSDAELRWLYPVSDADLKWLYPATDADLK